MSISREQWRLERVGASFPQRYVARISEDGRTISGCWEKAEYGEHFTCDFYTTYHTTSPRP